MVSEFEKILNAQAFQLNNEKKFYYDSKPKYDKPVLSLVVHLSKYSRPEKIIQTAWENKIISNNLKKLLESSSHGPVQRIEVRMLLCVLKYLNRGQWYDSKCLVTASLKLTTTRELEFDDSACMLVYMEGGELNGVEVDVDSLYRKFKFSTTNSKVTQRSLRMSLSGLFSDLRSKLIPSSSKLLTKIQYLIKNTRDSFEHLNFDKNYGRQWSHTLQALSFLAYLIADDKELLSEVFTNLNVIPWNFSRRTYLAVPDWMWRNSFDKYEDVQYSVKIHENIVFFLEWESDGCNEITKAIKELFYGPCVP